MKTFIVLYEAEGDVYTRLHVAHVKANRPLLGKNNIFTQVFSFSGALPPLMFTICTFLLSSGVEVTQPVTVFELALLSRGKK